MLRLIAILSTNIRDMTGIKKMTGSQDISVKKLIGKEEDCLLNKPFIILDK